jgi:prepilin-type processing-associated H-X9-DG protein
MVLPELSESTVFNSINFSFGPEAVVNQTAAERTIETFMCPTDPLSDKAGTNYAINVGSGYTRWGHNGALRSSYYGQSSISDITDGTSTTAMASEWLRGPQVPIAFVNRHSPLPLVFSVWPPLHDGSSFDQFAAICQGLEVQTAPVWRTDKGREWMSGFVANAAYNHVLVPNSTNCANGNSADFGAVGASSGHTGTVGVLFVDGSVKGVSQSIALDVWRAIGSRNGGETAVEKF